LLCRCAVRNDGTVNGLLRVIALAMTVQSTDCFVAMLLAKNCVNMQIFVAKNYQHIQFYFSEY
jgi:hypothetical protein